MIRTTFAAIVTLLALSSPAAADCICTCVNGQVQAICENALDLRPICSPRVCPIDSPSVRPLQIPTLPPIGTRTCAQERVQNPWTGRYEWQTICR